MEDIISKKEVLQMYSISYGALYRWKRMGLIPEEWFVKRSAVTGQETFFVRSAICERIEYILSMKDTCSLEELAERLKKEENSEKNLLKISSKTGNVSLLLENITEITFTDENGDEHLIDAEKFAQILKNCSENN